jgi:hypothetical protein
LVSFWLIYSRLVLSYQWIQARSDQSTRTYCSATQIYLLFFMFDVESLELQLRWSQFFSMAEDCSCWFCFLRHFKKRFFPLRFCVKLLSWFYFIFGLLMCSELELLEFVKCLLILRSYLTRPFIRCWVMKVIISDLFSRTGKWSIMIYFQDFSSVHSFVLVPIFALAFLLTFVLRC